MSLKKFLKFQYTLAFRLTIWYACISAISFSMAFLVFYLLLASTLNERRDQHLLNELNEFSSFLALKGIDELKTMMILEAESEGVEKVFFRLMTTDGQVVISSDNSSWAVGPGRRAMDKITDGAGYVFETITVPQHIHKIRILYYPIGKEYILQMCYSTEDNEKFLETSWKIFSLVIVLLMAFSALIGWYMARRALKGVEDITETAIRISDGEFHHRVPISGRGEEIDRLAITFNKMLERIQDLIKGVKEISDNIAHDLKSPITRIRGITEAILMNTKGDIDYETTYGSIIEECDRLLSMVNTMLDISEVESGVSKMDISEVDISMIVRDACEIFKPIADDKSISLIQKIGTGITIWADNQKIQRAVANLLDNALKYTLPGGTVIISMEHDEKKVTISVKDDGIGISEEDLPKIFNRFYRCDPSRSQPGVGLGLSLAQAIAKAHGGIISVISSYNKGSNFNLILPFHK